MRAFSKLGNKVFIIIIRPENKKPRISSFKENELDVMEIHPPSIGLKGKTGVSRQLMYLACLPAVQKAASKIINENNIDFVYANMPGTGSSVPAMRIQSKHKIKFVLDLADMYSLVRPKIVVERSFKKADKIITITNYLKNDLVNKGINPEKIFIIPNGVDLGLFNPDVCEKNEIAKLRNSFNSEKLVVFAGSLQDLNIIIKSAKHVIKTIPNTKFVILGDHRDSNRSKSSWEYKVKQNNLSNHFEFLGRKPRNEIPKYLLCADICIDSFPDEPYYAAAHPIKLLEYGACEKAVVATKVSETEKIVKHGDYGFLANPDNPEEYAQYIIKLLKSPELCKKMGTEFAKFVTKNFGWEKIALDLQKSLQN